jgi:hypothetical protein
MAQLHIKVVTEVMEEPFLVVEVVVLDQPELEVMHLQAQLALEHLQVVALAVLESQTQTATQVQYMEVVVLALAELAETVVVVLAQLAKLKLLTWLFL